MSLGYPANREDPPMRRRAVTNHRRGSVTGRQLDKALRAAGFAMTRWHGSHAIYTNGSGNAVVVPSLCHPGRDMRPGLIASINAKVLALTGHALEL